MSDDKAIDDEVFRLLYGDGRECNADGERRKLPSTSGYSDLDLEKIRVMKTRGFTNAEIAHVLGLPARRLELYMEKNPEFRAMMDEWREVANGRVERSLFENAVGFEHPETKVFYDSKTGQIVEHTVRKYYPPNVTAGKLWLMNKKPSKWKERIGHEMIGPDGNPMKVAHNINVTFVTPKGDDGDETEES